MKHCYNQRTLKKNFELINKFKILYESGFPDENEREDFEVILKRVSGDKTENEPHSIILLHSEKNKKEVAGGLIADWYEKSKCIHLTYLIIDESQRNKGIATILINEGVASVIEWIKKSKGIEIRNVFFESNIPWKTKQENDNFDAVERLRIFSKLGAKWIDIPYIQPALDTEKATVDNLFLLSFTQFNVARDKIEKTDVVGFLKDLYLGLGVDTPEQSDDFKAMTDALEKITDNIHHIDLFPIPYEKKSISNHSEKSSFKFDKASVTIHFIEKEEKANKVGNDCNFFSSFERDLMNFQNQRNQPLKNIVFRPGIKAKVSFPKYYRYTSEGCTHKIVSKSKDKNVILSISYSQKLKPLNQRIWHLTVKPAKGESFSEYDLIKLVTFFGSTQEEQTVSEKIRFFTEAGKPGTSSVIEFIESIIRQENSLKLLRTGIVQLDIENLLKAENGSLVEFFNTFQKDERHLFSNDKLKLFAQALCGIVLGIFDFHRMEDDEINDTIQPVMASGSSFMVLCRGNLLKISENDEIMDAVADKIVVSPYLLVPSVVLSYNEYILSEAKEMLDITLADTSKLTLNKLGQVQYKVNEIINFKYLNDIFHYPSEQTIIEKGELQRGIVQTQKNIAGRLDELFKVIEMKQENRSNLSDAFLNAFLGLIAMVQLNSIFTDLLKFEHNELIVYGIEVALAVVIFLLVRVKKGVKN